MHGIGFPDEPRYLAIGKIDQTCYTAIFTERGDDIRIISVRRSRPNERILHEFLGSHPAGHGGKGDEEDLTEMVAGVAAVAGGLNGGENLETLREAAGTVDFVRISKHSGMPEVTR